MPRRSLVLCLMAILAAFSGCKSPEKRRADEVERFKIEMSARVAALGIDADKPLSMDQCVAIALRNSLDYRVRQLRASIQSDRVRQSFADFLPKFSAVYSDSKRSNEALAKSGGTTVELQDQRQQAFSVQGTMPLFDWGSTFFGYRIARDRKSQEFLLLERSRQTLERDVRIAYARLASMQRQERLGRIGVLAARELVRAAEALEREGLSSHAETAAVQANLAQAALLWSGQRRAVEQLRMALAQLLSLPPGFGFSIDDTEQPMRPIINVSDIPGLEASALMARPELLAQDRANRIAADSVRQEFAKFLPRVDGQGSYNWSSQSGLVNPGFYQLGFTVMSSLLDGTAQIWRYRAAQKASRAEEENSLLLSLSIVYDVDLSVLQLYTAYDTVVAHDAVVKAQQEALKQIISLYLQGLETGTVAAATLAQVYQAQFQLDDARTSYDVACYQLDTAAGIFAVAPQRPAIPSIELPAFQPTPTLDTLQKMLQAIPQMDLREIPEIRDLLNSVERGQ